MKKALSLLIVFAMLCVPMAVSAAVGDGIAMPETCIYSGDTVTVEAGATAYFEIGTGMTAGTYDFVVEGNGDFDVAICTEGPGDGLPYAEGTPVAAVDGKVETEITSFESTYNYAAFSITNNSSESVDYQVTILFPEGTMDNPKAVTLNAGDSTQVSVPAGEAYYIAVTLPAPQTEFQLTVTGAPGFRVGAGMGMPAPDNGGSYVGSISAFFGPANFSILNNTATAQTYTISIDNMPAGATENNPEILTESGDFTASFANGHFYSFTAPKKGTFTVTMNAEEGWQYQINGVLANGEYYYGDMHWCDDDPVVASESIDVEEGDVYTIYIAPYATIETTVEWSFSFEEVAFYDVNNDGKFNMFDYYVVKNIYFNDTDDTELFNRADVNGDGSVNVFDYYMIKTAYFAQ